MIKTKFQYIVCPHCGNVDAYTSVPLGSKQGRFFFLNRNFGQVHRTLLLQTTSRPPIYMHVFHKRYVHSGVLSTAIIETGNVLEI